MKCNLGVNLQLSNYKDLGRGSVFLFRRLVEVTLTLLLEQSCATVCLSHVYVETLDTDIFNNKCYAAQREHRQR